MKKFSLFAVASLLLLAGCSESEDNLATDQSNTIEFRSVVNKSRASLVGQYDLENFFVVGLQGATQTDFLSASVYKDAASWTYSPKKYWPTNGDVINFYAFAPYSSAIMTGLAEDGNGSAEFSYTVPVNQNEANKAVDLLVAKESGSKTTVGPIAFTFTHALSAVTFSAENQNSAGSELVYTIDKIAIINLDNEGVYNYANGWTPETTYNVTYKAGVPESGVAVQPGAGFVNLLSANDMMMVLPQEPDAIAKVVITYSLKDGEGIYIYENEPKTLNLPTSFKFEVGVRYNFTFTFDASNAIVFNVEEVTPYQEWP